MPPAFSASRAGVTPEASGHGSSGTFGRKMYYALATFMSLQHSIHINALPEEIFREYTDVASWKSWDPELLSSSLDGIFCEGATGRLKPRKGPPALFMISEVSVNCSFTVESKLPFCIMRFTHELIPEGGTTKVIHGVEFHGPLAFVFTKIIGKQIYKSLPVTLAGLKRRVELPLLGDEANETH